MKEFTNIDFVIPILAAILGLVMKLSPRTFIPKVPISEESLKTEKLLEKLGIGVIILSIAFAILIYVSIYVE